MSTVSVLNTDSGLSGKTIDLLESDQTITGAKTFDRDPSAPFVVTSGSAKVSNLDADKLDGQDWTSPTIVTPTITGLTTLTGGQIAFPAAQSASSNVNTLDDYEEGVWTPVIGGSGGTSGQTYSNQEGRYIKIGSFVWATCYVALTAKGTITSTVQIQGLPFTAETGGGSQYFVGGGFQWGALATNWVNITARITQGTSAADIMGAQAANTANTGQLLTADITNTSAFLASLMYRASA